MDMSTSNHLHPIKGKFSFHWRLLTGSFFGFLPESLYLSPCISSPPPSLSLSLSPSLHAANRGLREEEEEGGEGGTATREGPMPQ